ncbi:hypothetical protein WAI453_006866 [Rhynchosporium graminicola]|uniref:Related to SWI1 Component of SWI/SNF global transcription activator complex n=1 Tax=Rhynchosporium graminicola TaxID=2792576 RepID=A0A1E1KTF0_9HELO|nr:related to SWI1 Component of SWI/SNF global transcription activator complex [Rhynchosporium commune]
MSSSSWLNEAAVQNHNGAGFNHLDPNANGSMLDPSTLMNNPSSFDPSQYQNQQLQQRVQNGTMRNGSGSPSFNSPVYQTNSVVPSKRSRPREDSLGASPRQTPGMPPGSRSQTPQQAPYPGFPQNNGTTQHAPQQPPYAHLQNGSANASPSPIMANQLRPGGVPQRVSTASPHPFSPAAQQFPQVSPSQSEQGGRTGTPQPTNPYAQNPGFTQGFAQNFTPPPQRTSGPPQSGMSTPQMQQPHMQQPQMYQQGQQQPQPGQQRSQNPLEQQKLMYHQMQMQHQIQQRNMIAARQGGLPPGASPMAKGAMHPGMRPQQPPNPSRNGPNPESFMKSLVAFMQQKGLPLDMNPVVGDRQVSLLTLYMAVMKFGGFKKVSQQNGWPQVAQAMQFHPMQISAAPQQLRGHYERNLLLFEEAWQINQQRQRTALMQQNPNMPVGPQMSPTKQMNPQTAQQSPGFLQQQHINQPHHSQQPHPHTTPVKQTTPIHHAQHPSVNGFSTPQQSQIPHAMAMAQQNHSRNSLSRGVDATPSQNGSAFTMPSPRSATKTRDVASPQLDAAMPADGVYDLPDLLDPRVRVLDNWGGTNLESLAKIGDKILPYRPDMPPVSDMGTIDIHALSMSLQSGINAEVRMALDTLASLTLSTAVRLDVRQCEDLVDTIIDCAEVQVELLAENAAEVSDVMLISSYEDVARACRFDHQSLREIPAINSTEYELDRAVERLICLTTILRNLSFEEVNHAHLADELVIKFLCVVIRYLGTRNMLLRTNQNTMDFMKDVITFLSNLAQSIELPGREQALCLIHFLLAFAPCPPPNTMNPSTVSFSPYEPAIHIYLPCAVDTLAKLLARDEPNRSHYKTIFASDVASFPPFDLLTRTFGLAISIIPDEKPNSKRGGLLSTVEARKPSLMQGMLAAEILSNLAPGYEAGVARSWLTSDDGFAQKLSRLIVMLCLEASPHPPNSRAPVIPKGVDDEALLHVTVGGIAVLRRLTEKSKDLEDLTSNIPLQGLPSKEILLGALRVMQPRLQGVLKQLCAYAGLGI